MELPPTYGKSCRANNARGVIRRCPGEPADNRKRLFALRNQDPPQSGLFVVVDSDLDYNNPVVQVRIDR
ncbi:hypothetical protein QK360_29655, partial [Pseudomonas aeruginosa]|nr:hypothetical protein [Pseudomonas aeruginosa]MDI3749902.1 hypothetical protein [Pseudomonas aeruginosa]